MRTTVDVTIVEVIYGALSPIDITQALTDIVRRHDEQLVQVDDASAHTGENCNMSSSGEVK